MPLHTFVHSFEGRPLVTLTHDGRPCWVARHIGARLGYSHGGKRLPNKILGEWADEFIEDVDYAFLTGDDLSALRAVSGIETVPHHARRGLLILFESGLHLVLVKTRSPLGRLLRRFLVDQVLPQIARTGRFDPFAGAADPSDDEPPPAASAGLDFGEEPVEEPALPPVVTLAERREARMLLQATVRERWVDLCDRRLRVAALYRLVEVLGPRLSGDERAVMELLAAQVGSRLPLVALLLDRIADHRQAA